MSNSSRESGYYREPARETPHLEDPSLDITFLGKRVELWKFLPSSKRVRSLSDLAYTIAKKLEVQATTYDAVHGLDIALQKSGLTAIWSEGGYTINSARADRTRRRKQESAREILETHKRIEPSDKQKRERSSRAHSNRKNINLGPVEQERIIAQHISQLKQQQKQRTNS